MKMFVSVFFFTDCLSEEFLCPTGHWKCTNGRCITDRFVCDGNLDCSDESDEENCASWPCVEGQMKCADQLECVEVKNECVPPADPMEKFCHHLFCANSRAPKMVINFKLFVFGMWLFQIDQVCANNGFDCNDGSDELCDDPCVAGSFRGTFTMKARNYKLKWIQVLVRVANDRQPFRCEIPRNCLIAEV